MTHIKLKGYGTFENCSRTAKVIKETKTMIIVEWGEWKKRFRKNTGHAIGNSDRWSGWRIENAEGVPPVDKEVSHAIKQKGNRTRNAVEKCGIGVADSTK